MRVGKLLEVHCANCRPERAPLLNPEIGGIGPGAIFFRLVLRSIEVGTVNPAPIVLEQMERCVPARRAANLENMGELRRDGCNFRAEAADQLLP